MAKTVNRHESYFDEAAKADHEDDTPNWQRKISNHIAYALLAYTALQIFVVIGELGGHDGGMSMLPYLGLVVLIGLVIPVCRKFEKIWERRLESGMSQEAIARQYKFDRIMIWLTAIGFPFLLVAIFRGFSAVSG